MIDDELLDENLDPELLDAMELFQQEQPVIRTDFGSLQVRDKSELKVGSVYRLVNGYVPFEFMIQIVDFGETSFSYHALHHQTLTLSPINLSRYSDYSMLPYKCGTWNSVNYIERILLN